MPNPLSTGAKAGCSIAALILLLPILAAVVLFVVWVVWAIVKTASH